MKTMKKYGLLIDYKYCTGCHSCEISCRNEKGLPIDEWGIKVIEVGPVKMRGEWMWNYVPVLSDLCDLCIGRIEGNAKPACVHHCLAQCMEAVPVEKISESMAEKGDAVVCYIP